MKPVVVRIFGDPVRKLEPEHHRIEFPGGTISVDRTSDGLYWAHIAIASRDAVALPTHEGSAVGKVVGSRVDFDHAEYRRRLKAGLTPIPDIEGIENAEHFAVCIRPVWREERST